MSKQSERTKESHYVTTLRSQSCPAIAANIFRRPAPDGETYLDYEISRAWKSGDRQGYSTRLYARHRDGIKEVVDLATEWIENYPQSAEELGERSINGGQHTSPSAQPE